MLNTNTKHFMLKWLFYGFNKSDAVWNKNKIKNTKEYGL